jgi:hypothetical protein
MLNRFLTMAIVISALGTALEASAQRETEMFIPIGQSPGISSKTSVIGTVETVNAAGRTVTVVGPTGSQTFAITEQTRIWVDRSLVKLTNQTGSLADLQKGRKVEVNPQPPGPQPLADWIKVQVPAAGGGS